MIAPVERRTFIVKQSDKPTRQLVNRLIGPAELVQHIEGWTVLSLRVGPNVDQSKFKRVLLMYATDVICLQDVPWSDLRECNGWLSTEYFCISHTRTGKSGEAVFWRKRCGAGSPFELHGCPRTVGVKIDDIFIFSCMVHTRDNFSIGGGGGRIYWGVAGNFTREGQYCYAFSDLSR